MKKTFKTIQNIILMLIGLSLFFAVSMFMFKFFEEEHFTQFELCEKEARKIYLETFQIDTSQLTKNILVDWDMPKIVLKTLDYDGSVIISYSFQRGEIITIYQISPWECFLSVITALLCIFWYIFIIYILNKIKIQIIKKGK